MSVTYSGRLGEESERQLWKRVPNTTKITRVKKTKPKTKRKQATHHSNLVCSICKKRIRKTDPAKNSFKMRMKRLRDHRKKHHPTAFKKSIRKGIRTKKERK